MNKEGRLKVHFATPEAVADFDRRMAKAGLEVTPKTKHIWFNRLTAPKAFAAWERNARKEGRFHFPNDEEVFRWWLRHPFIWGNTPVRQRRKLLDRIPADPNFRTMSSSDLRAAAKHLGFGIVEGVKGDEIRREIAIPRQLLNCDPESLY